VTDTGIGIPPGMLTRVFEIFTQVGGPSPQGGDGLGVGLTLVKRLIEMHGGSVTAESPGPGRGSTFTLRFPVANQPADGSSKTATTTPPKRLRRILIVDDNRDAAESLAFLLRILGHEVRSVVSGEEALQVLNAFQSDVILLDLGMPGMTGYDLARRIRERPEGTAAVLVALSGWGQAEDRQRTKECGFNYHLVKPADLSDIERILCERD
jgi:CheY-like chemotaxis protein